MGIKKLEFPRRTFLSGTASLIGSFAAAQEAVLTNSVEIEPVITKKLGAILVASEYSTGGLILKT